MIDDSASSDQPRRILDDLIRQRQAMLRLAGPDPRLLEANRLSLVYWQLQVARAAKSVPSRA